MHRNQTAATVPGSITPDRVSRRRGDGGEVARFANLVELYPECFGDHGDRRAPAVFDHAGHHDSALIIDRLTETEQLPHFVDRCCHASNR